MPNVAALALELPDAAVLTSLTGDVWWANTAAEELLGEPLGAWIGRNVLDAVHRDDHAIVVQACATVVDKPAGSLMNVRMRRRTGELIDVELRGRHVVQPEGDALLVVIRRIDDRDGLELAGNDATVLHRFVHHSPAILALLDDSMRVVSVNAALTRLLGHDTSLVCGREFVDLIDPDDSDRIHQALTQIDGTLRRVVAVRSIGGEVRYFDMHATDLRLEQAVGGIVVTMSDITELRVVERQLRELADLDPLTGLMNRRAFENRLDHILAADTPDVAVVFADLDQFKDINDTYGHDGGDRVLIEIARRLQSITRPGDLVGRFGGDEFVVAIVGDARTRLTHIKIDIETVVTQPIRLPAGDALVGVTIGTALCVTSPTTTKTLVDAADRDMYNTKRSRSESRHAIRTPTLDPILTVANRGAVGTTIDLISPETLS